MSTQNRRLPPRFLPLLAIALIIGLAFTIRIWNLTKESFWADEGWTMILSKGPTLADVVQTMASDQHPPLYFVIMHGWIQLAGNSEFSTRFVSLIWSVIGVALIYRVGADVFSPEAGLLGALMLALADNDTFLAQDARHYTQMAALATISALFYLRYWKHGGRINGVGWLLTSSALLYTHYLGAFMLAIQFIHLLLFARPIRKLADMVLRWGAIWVSWLPWAFVFVNQSLVRYTRPMLFQSTWPNTPEALSIVRSDLIGSQFALTGGLILLGLIYVTYTAGIARIRLRPLWPTAFMLLWLAFPIVAIIGLNTRYPILTTRNFLIVSPVIALLIGHGFTNLDRFPRRLLLLILVAVMLFTVDAYFIKPPWRQIAQDILQYRAEREPVIMNVWTDDFALRYHIGRDLHTDPADLPLISMPEWRDQYRDGFYAKLLDYLKDKPTFWLANWSDENDPLLKWFSDQGYTRTSTQFETHLAVNKIYVYRYDRLKADTPTLADYADRFTLASADAHLESLDGARNVRVNMLWKVNQKPSVDYSISVFLLGSDGNVVASYNSSPLNGHSPTTTWKPGDIYFDSKLITIPAMVPPGTYQVGLKVYWYVDQKPLPVLRNGETQTSDYYVVKSLQIEK